MKAEGGGYRGSDLLGRIEFKAGLTWRRASEWHPARLRV